MDRLLILNFLNFGGPEIILILIVFGGLTLLPAFLGYSIGSQRSIGGLGGLLIGLCFSYLGVLIVYLISSKNQAQFFNFNQSTADELKKYKDLLDRGAITEQEYQAQKARILYG